MEKMYPYDYRRVETQQYTRHSSDHGEVDYERPKSRKMTPQYYPDPHASSPQGYTFQKTARVVSSPQSQRQSRPSSHDNSYGSLNELDARPRQRQQPPKSKSQFSYEPHRANNIVFDDDSRKRKQSSKFNLFNKKLAPQQPQMYIHSTGSDDALELMPTIAMGYENSLDQRLKKMPNPGELRITGSGYYFDPEVEEDLEEKSAADDGYGERGRTLMSPVRVQEKNELLIRTDSDRGLQRRLESSRSGSRGRLLDEPAGYQSRSRSQSRHVDKEDKLGNDTAKKGGYFKKLFSTEKSKHKNKLKRTSEVEQFLISPESTVRAKTPSHLHVEHAHDERSAPCPQSIPSTPIHDSPRLENSPQGGLDQPASLVDVLSSIPVISYIFTKIDENQSLSDQTKLLIKIALIVWIMYEMHTIMEAVSRIFNL